VIPATGAAVNTHGVCYYPCAGGTPRKGDGAMGDYERDRVGHELDAALVEYHSKPWDGSFVLPRNVSRLLDRFQELGGDPWKLEALSGLAEHRVIGANPGAR
jgi:hypothetical protein